MIPPCEVRPRRFDNPMSKSAKSLSKRFIADKRVSVGKAEGIEECWNFVKASLCSLTQSYRTSLAARCSAILTLEIVQPPIVDR
jgi:hypothetical protein